MNTISRLHQFVLVCLILVLSSFSVHADDALFQALEAAGIPMTPTIADQIQAAQTDQEIAAAITALVESLGEDGDAIAAAVGAAVTAAPDSAAAIVGAAIDVVPSLASVIVGAAVTASPANAGIITAAAVNMRPTQVEAIVAAATGAAPDQVRAIDSAAAGALEQIDPQQDQDVLPSPS